MLNTNDIDLNTYEILDIHLGLLFTIVTQFSLKRNADYKYKKRQQSKVNIKISRILNKFSKMICSEYRIVICIFFKSRVYVLLKLSILQIKNYQNLLQFELLV